ncbi:MAG: N-6 DNA methylase [Undibacterium sp.]|nr:N-6 DNA methylase [Opitutaceae bacterium]
MPDPIAKIFSSAAWVDLPTARFFGSIKEQAADSDARVHLHHSRRFYEKESWGGVITVENRPAVYLLRRPRCDFEAESRLHRSLWNQGVAHLLVVCDPTNVRIYSAHARPHEHAIREDGQDERLVESLRTADFALQTRDFALRLETGAYFREHARAFEAQQNVDRYLLKNLRDARDELTSGSDGLSRPAAHTLLGRVLFICYLRDRGIIGAKQFAAAGADKGIESLRELFTQQTPGSAKSIFFKLLRLLKDDFNGSLFDHPSREEERGIELRHIKTLGQFLSGEEIGKRQMALGFAAYDFGLIPIETISGIYEEFLAAENADDKAADGAFYTPKRLAEITADLASEEWSSLVDKRVLDPSCGSGIFLVLAFNRMAEEWRHTHPHQRHRTRADALRNMLTHQICGVDVNRTACRIAAFSLYVAFFDQFTPRDLDEVRASLAVDGQKVLPPLLPEEDALSTERVEGGLLDQNFFELTLERLGTFDLILGNPPWVGRNQVLDQKMVKWVEGARATHRSPLMTARQKKAPLAAYLPQNQSAHAFMWKVRDHLAPGIGRACLILPSKVWLNKDTNEFQRYWSRAVTLEGVVQLSDARKILFDDAVCPCTLARFTASPPPSDHTINYIVPKVEVSEPGELGCMVLPDDHKRVTQIEWQNAADAGLATVLWKKRFWGTLADELLIERLLKLPSIDDLAGLEREKKRWLKGQGFQPNSKGNAKKPVPVFWKPTDAFLDARSEGLDLVLFEEDTHEIGTPYKSLYFARNPLIYRPPMVLTNQGFDWAAYCDFPVLFQAAIQSIHGDPKDAHLLKFLAGYLGSDLAHYFAFHTSANWGIERDKVHLEEVLRAPFPLPEQQTDPKRAVAIVHEVGAEMERVKREIRGNFLRREAAVRLAREKINGLVFDYFGLSEHERALVADTINVAIPSSTPASRKRAMEIPSIKSTTSDERFAYAKNLVTNFSRWGGANAATLAVEIHVSNRSGLAALVLSPSRQKISPKESLAEGEASVLLERIHRQMRREYQSAPIPYHRGCAILEEDRIVMLKPLALRHWTYSAAFADAGQLAGALLRDSMPPVTEK